ncbi:MAG: osmoprotectant ABC transporter substrate-binding protein [Firmicutes bacterium]|nr:osmoprotectant ABC transporter substrate-binding protein [Bacillota bacterium]
MKFKRTIAALLLVLMALTTSCTLPGIGANTDEDIVVASGSNTERLILGEIVAQMIEHDTDLKVDMIPNLSSSILNHIAMLKGDVNVVGGMYTGTALTGELGMEPIKDPDEAMKVVQDEYYKRWNRLWYPSFGFENTYAFMVTKEFAEEHDVKKVSDLEKLKGDLRVGVDTAWITRKGDGYEAFQDLYGFKFNQIYPMQIGLVYTALATGEMDVVLGYSTDGKIASYDLVLLEDDRKLFPPYDCSPVSTLEIAKKHPEVYEVILKLCGKISTETMQELNRRADEDLVEPSEVAREFLEEHNYFEGTETDKQYRIFDDIVKGEKE